MEGGHLVKEPRLDDKGAGDKVAGDEGKAAARRSSSGVTLAMTAKWQRG